MPPYLPHYTICFSCGKNKINSIDHKSDIDAMREAYYGDEYKAVLQKKAEEKLQKLQKNILLYNIF